MKRWICFLVSLGCLCTLCGCTGATPLKDKLIVEGIAVDVSDRNYLVTLQAYLPSAQPEGGSKSQLFDATGQTVYEALSKIDEQVGKISFYADTKVILLSRQSLERGLWENIDPFVRSSEMGSNVCVAATQGKAADLFAIEKEGNNMPAQMLENGLRYGTNNNTPVSGELMQVAAGLEDPTSGIAIPMVKVAKKGNKKVAHYTGILCFKGDKPYRILNERMKWGYNWLNEYGENRGFVVKTGENTASLLYQKTKTHVDVTIVNQRPHFAITIDSTCEITESVNPAELTNQGIHEITVATQNKMKSIVEDTLKTMVNQQGCDVFRLGKNLRKQHPYYFKGLSNWETACAQSTFTVRCLVTVTRMGQQAMKK